MTIYLYFLIIHYILKWAAQTQDLNQEQKYTYDKIDLKFVSVDQEPYQCNIFISTVYPPLNVKKYL